MLVYIYQADLYCQQCGEAIRAQITEEGSAPVNPDDETSYTSDDFPKGPYPDGGGEADSPQHCAMGSKCVNTIKLTTPSMFSDGNKIGAWLENPLTTDGVKYVRKAIEKGGEVAELWAEYYRDVL